MPPQLDKLFRHLAWADDRALAALRRAGAGHSPALELLAHVLAAEHVWLARLTGVPARHAVWPALALEDCAALARENQAGFTALLRSLTPAELGREVPYTNSAGLSFRSSVEDILLHVALHGSYHRGQVAQLLRQGGVAPEPTDFIGFVRGVPAATRQS